MVVDKNTLTPINPLSGARWCDGDQLVAGSNPVGDSQGFERFEEIGVENRLSLSSSLAVIKHCHKVD